MLQLLTFRKPTKTSQPNGTLISTKLTEHWRKKSFTISQKPLTFSQTIAGENTMMKCSDWNSHSKMHTKLLRTSLENMASWTKRRKSFSIPITPKGPKTTTKFWEFRETLRWKISKKPTGSWLSNITPRTIQKTKKPRRNSFKWMRLITHCLTSLKGELTMTYSLARLLLSEHTLFSTTFSAADHLISRLKTISLNQSSTVHGEKDWITWWTWRTLMMWRKVSQWRPQACTRTRTAYRQRRMWLLKRRWRMDEWWRKKLKTICFQVEWERL